MQEENKKAGKSFIQKVGLLNLICVSLFVGSILLAIGAVSYIYRDLPTHHWGAKQTELPWSGYDILVNHVKCGWEDVSHNEWLKHNGISHAPYIEMELGECTGSGTLYIQFKDATGAFVGQPVTLIYSGGILENSSRNYYQANGKKLMVYAYPSFKSTRIISNREQFRKYNLDDNQALWQAVVYYSPIIPDQPNLREKHMLGFSTIPKGISNTSEQP